VGHFAIEVLREITFRNNIAMKLFQRDDIFQIASRIALR